MKFSHTLTTVALITTPLTSATAISIPDSNSALSIRHSEPESLPNAQVLEKRRGGGGGGGRGSSGSSSSGSSSSGSSSSSSSSSSSGGRSGSSGSSNSGSSSGGTGSSANVRGGGTTNTPTFSNGVYPGGTKSPYRAGGNLPGSNRAPILAGAGLGLAGGALLFGGAPYYYYGPYGYRYPYRNNQTNTNDTLPISCVCAQYNPCGCEEIDQKEIVDEQLEDGTANITTVNGTRTVVINGTLDNGTTSGAVHAFTVAGGSFQMVWPVAMMVGAMVWG